MAKPVSISVKQISDAARESVAGALKRHDAIVPKPDYRLGFIPPWWWCGVVIDPQQPVELAQAGAFSNQVHAEIAKKVPAVATGKPGVISSGGHIICGFLPGPEVDLIEE